MVINKLRGCVALLLLMVTVAIYGQVPEAQNPPRLVNDFANIFTPEQVKTMEDSLVLFNKKTSNQIVVVTMNDLGGMDKAQMAYSIGEKWGVGGKKFNNGVVILVKPKTDDSRGEVFIATGYGIEGALPDAACRAIIENEMIPSFKNNDYYGGVEAALAVVKPIMAKEYTYEQYQEDNDLPLWLGIVLVIGAAGFVVFILIIASKGGNGNNGNNSGTLGGGGFFIGGLPMSGGRSSGGSSGFGGFGGGSFGGGGAGGSW